MNLRELAFQLSAITLIADAAKEAKDRLRREFAAALDEVGADAAKAVLEGEEIAKVSLIHPKTSAEVLNEKAFVDWVKSNCPKVQERFEVNQGLRMLARAQIPQGLSSGF